MALLHYENLRVRRPDVLLRRAFFGLKIFYDFLRRTKDYAESDAAVKRLAWTPGPGPDDDDDDDDERADGCWIQLTEPADRTNEPESTFRAFLDENVSKIYEAHAAQETIDRNRPVRLDFGRNQCIEIVDRDPGTVQLLLEREPEEAELLLRPNTWPLQCQIQALQTLQNAPSREHLPLLRLFESVEHARWPSTRAVEVALDEWMVLTNDRRPGTEEQRRFVQLALASPDFAFLEGPPGSGKTTAICELVLQLAREGKRALLCASTHVAVDNVLERIMDERNQHRDLVIPIRIGDRRNVSEKARPWQLERFVQTERERLLDELRRVRSPSPSQRALRSVLQHGSTVVERLVLDAANLVCGTTIGLLQHPDIKVGGHGTPAFDVLIVDEASKTTFQEFLVPALLAKRWIIVGDPKQLSPYVDDAAMAVNIASCLPKPEIRAACVDTFIAGHRSRKQRTTVAAVTASGLGAYRAQADARGVDLATPSDDGIRLATAPLVAGELPHLVAREDDMPLDVAIIRAPDGALPGLRCRADAWNRMQKRRAEEEPSWSGEIGWRLARLYEQRFADSADTGGRKTTAQRLHDQVEGLLPDDRTGATKEDVWSEIDRVRRVALPSVLESLRHGFERDSRQRHGSALSDGLPAAALDQRHVLLSTQHRMHGDIAAFSHEHIYGREALHTPHYLNEQREWNYARYAHRALWLDVRGGFNRKFNANRHEAQVVIDELREFDYWARRYPRDDGHPWEVAVLTFYRGQERELREHLRRWTKNHRGMRHFPRGSRSAPYLTIELCTIDRFQGHEADLVLITVASPHPTSFLESPNRLNVALTRARFQRVVVGNRTRMFDARALETGASQRSVLAELAANEAWDSVEVRS